LLLVEVVVEPMIASLSKHQNDRRKKPTKMVVSTGSATGEPISEN